MITNARKIILCATNTSLTAGIWLGTKLQSYTIFQNEDDDHTKFSHFLTQHPNLDVYFVVDAVEEDYRVESLPHTSGRAKRELIERKLNQFNRTSVYRAAHFINRGNDKRKDDNYLFVALNNSDFLKSWMDVIQAVQAPLVGVYLLPMISQVMVRQMRLMSPNIMYCERLSSGLRQTFLHNGRLRMSRLVPMEDVKPHQVAYFYLVEIEKTRLYLLSQRLIAGETPLKMILPAYDASYEQIAKSISQDQGFECKTVDIFAYARNNGISRELTTKRPELLHMQLLANGHVPDNLAPESFIKTHNLNRLSRSIYFTAAASFVAGAILAGLYYWIGNQDKAKVSEVAAQTQEQLHRYDVVSQNFPSTPIPSTELKIASDIADAIKNNRQTPREFFQVLSAACENSPEITLSRMHWMLTNQLDIKDDVENSAAAANNNGAAADLTNPTNQAGKLFQVGFVNAEIKSFNGDYRAALTSVSQFAARLRANPMVEQVIVLQEPVNVSSLADLQGSTTDETTTERTPALFKLKVMLKPIQHAEPAR